MKKLFVVATAAMMLAVSTSQLRAAGGEGKDIVDTAVAAGSLRQLIVGTRRRQGIAPCLPGSQPGGSLLAVRRSLAGRIRTPVPPR